MVKMLRFLSQSADGDTAQKLPTNARIDPATYLRRLVKNKSSR
jgi:hypothetical protein